MTAPGDSVLIFILVALFVACCGYAAGRVHQRWQLKRDREEAYRDGYETASDQVFSLAVRTAVPKRADPAEPPPAEAGAGVYLPTVSANPGYLTGAVAGGDPGQLPETNVNPGHLPAATANPGRESGVNPGRAIRHQGVAPSVPPIVADHPSAPAREDSPFPHPRRPQAGSGLGFPAPPPPPRNTLGEPAAVGGVNYQVFPDPRPAARPAESRPSAAPSAKTHSPEGHTLAAHSAEGHTPAAHSQEVHTRAAHSQEGHTPSAHSAEGHTLAAHSPEGHAADAHSSEGRATEPRRFGVRAAEARHSEAHAAEARHFEGHGAEARSSEARAAESRAAESRAAEPRAAETRSSGGKHTVPDELVQAATYRLPADRVFRARVPNSTPLPDEPTTNLPVPKPRRP